MHVLYRHRSVAFFVLIAAAIVALPAARSGRVFASSSDDANSDEKKDHGLPLKPERKIEFTTTEGTWTSVDVSPDGRTLIFDMVGNLYSIPIDGGEAKRITNEGMSFNAEPRFSPDGARIAFVSDRDGGQNVWTSKPDGSDPKQVTHDGKAGFVSPSWTPDGQYIVVTRIGAFGDDALPQLWMYNVNGGSGLQISKGSGSPLGVIASADGRYLYYTMRGANYQVARRDRQTGEEEVITRASGGAVRPMLSPDGSMLIYGSRRDAQTGLRVLELKSGEERWLKYPTQRDEQQSFGLSDLLPGYAFLPGGKEIVVSYGGKIHRVDVSSGADRIIPYTAHVTVDLGPKLDFPIRVDDGPNVQARILQGPVQSPDGRRLVFSAFARLYVTDIPGGTPKPLTNANLGEFDPAWSPDGRWLAYVTWNAQDGGGIWKISADGGTPQKLTQTPAYFSAPAWSADGSRIVALSEPRQRFLDEEWGETLSANGEPFRLIWISSEGGENHVIAPAQGARHPHFSADGDRVYAEVYNSPNRELVSMRWDGSERRTEVKFVGRHTSDFTLRTVTVSPDGKWVAVLFEADLYIVAMPAVGGEAPVINLSAGAVPVKKISDIGPDYIAWAEGGRTITWGVGSKFYRQSVASISFEPEKKKDGDSAAASDSSDAKHAFEEIAVSVERPRKKPSGVVVLRAAQVITMKGDEVISDADIVVTDNRITAVGKRGTVQIPSGAKIIDVKGNTIIPGLVDTHDHHDVNSGLLDAQSWDFLAHVAYGVTSGRDPQTQWLDMIVYEDLVDSGDMIGQRDFSTGPGIFWSSDFLTAEDVLTRVKKYKDYYRLHTIKSYLVGNRKQRQWMVEACKKLEIMPTTEGGSDTMMDLTHAIDGFAGTEHALPIVPLYEDAVEVMAKSGIAYTPTFVVNYGGPEAEDYFYQTNDIFNDPKIRRFFPHEWLDRKTGNRQWHRKDQYHFPLVAASAGKILKEGGLVCMGGHGQFAGVATHWELWSLQSGGVSNHDVLRAGTINGAKAIGYAQDLGSIEAGKLADLVILSRDPLQDIHNTMAIRYVMKNGELFEGETMNQVWPQQKPLPTMWWQKDSTGSN